MIVTIQKAAGGQHLSIERVGYYVVAGVIVRAGERADGGIQVRRWLSLGAIDADRVLEHGDRRVIGLSLLEHHSQGVHRAGNGGVGWRQSTPGDGQRLTRQLLGLVEFPRFRQQVGQRDHPHGDVGMARAQQRLPLGERRAKQRVCPVDATQLLIRAA